MREVKVTVTTKELQEHYIGLAEVIREKKNFPVEVNMAMAKNNAVMERELKAGNEAAKEIIDRFTMKDEQGEPVVKENHYVFEKKEDEEAYIKAMKELDEVEFECQVYKVSRSVFDDKHEEPTAYDFVLLDFMLED